MRRRSLLLATVVVVLGAACAPSSRPERTILEAPPPSAAVGIPSMTPSTYADPTVVRPGPPLPEPVPIPADPYAPEPVVEIGTMEIPAIGLVHRIYQGVTLRNIDQGPSHWTGSALPGEMGNTVFAGHRSTHDEPFRRIDALVGGDKVVFTVRGVRTTYTVIDHLVVTPADSWIADQSTASTGTLYACHPLGSTAERYVVRMTLDA